MMHRLAALLRKLVSLIAYIAYPQCRDMNPIHVLAVSFIPQKIFRINGSVPWPVHFTSRVLYHKNVVMGRRVAPGFSSCCYIQARNGIILGSNIRIGPGVGLISANHNIDNYDIWDKDDPIVIGDNVWIGMHAVILPGVTIGSNVVIGANAVVHQDIPDNSIALGNPCRVVREKPPYAGIDYASRGKRATPR